MHSIVSDQGYFLWAQILCITNIKNDFKEINIKYLNIIFKFIKNIS